MARNGAQAGATVSTGSVWTEAAWNEPAGLPARGTVLVIPGRGEEPALYRRLGRRLASDAYRVRVLPDPTISSAVTLDRVTGNLASPESPGPRVIAGSDTGALYAAILAASGELAGLDGLILAGMPTASNAPESRQGQRPSWPDELDCRTACTSHRTALNGSALRRGALFGPVPEGWLEAADLSRVKQPVLAIHGAADPVSPLSQARSWYRQAPAARLVSIADGRHDVLNDVTHRTVAATIVLFLERLRLGSDLPEIATAE